VEEGEGFAFVVLEALGQSAACASPAGTSPEEKG
jgi:hypothetical protein